MKNALPGLALATACAVSLLATARAQTDASERRPPRPHPVLSALDLNRDGTIDEREIAQASASLGKLDKNADGQLTAEEMRLPRIERGAVNPDAMAKRLMQFDRNADGKLSKDELPARLQPMIERGDADKDGFLTGDEIRTLSETPPGRSPRGGREQGERRDPAGHDD